MHLEPVLFPTRSPEQALFRQGKRKPARKPVLSYCGATRGGSGRFLDRSRKRSFLGGHYPGATRAHFMRSGLALVEQRFVVRTGGFLEFNPGALILQRQANLRQDTILEIEEGGEALLVEKLLPGRLAHGEIFRFDRFASRLRVRMKGRLALLESFRLSPEDASILPWKKSFPEPIYGAFYLFSEKVSEGLPSRDEIHAMATGKLLVGIQCPEWPRWLDHQAVGGRCPFIQGCGQSDSRASSLRSWQKANCVPPVLMTPRIGISVGIERKRLAFP